jgi:Transposase DDE domain
MAQIRASLQCPVVIAASRQRPQDFTRQRLLSFGRLCLIVWRGHKVSFQNALNKVFHALGDVFGVPTSSAYSHARQKLKPEVFTHLHRSLYTGFYQLYEADDQVRRWRGHRLLATDGTYLTLPDTPATRARYTVQTNQHAGADCVQAQCGVLYDLRNDLGLRLHLSARQSETRVLRDQLWSATQPADVVVLDRAYADYSLLAWAQATRRHLIVRLPRGRFAECEAFWHSSLREQSVTLALPKTASTRAFVAQQNLPHTIRVRLVRVLLSSGEVEVLLTTLCDAQAYPAPEFQGVYGERWGEETFFDRFKNIYEVERFSGTSVAAIEQDIHGLFFLMTLESILTKPEQAALAQQGAARKTKFVPQVNRAESYVALLDRVVQLLLSPQSEAQVLAELHHLFAKNPTLQRPGRQYVRAPLNYSKTVRYLKYRKKVRA